MAEQMQTRKSRLGWVVTGNFWNWVPINIGVKAAHERLLKTRISQGKTRVTAAVRRWECSQKKKKHHKKERLL